MLGHVEAERDEPVLVRARGRVDADELRRVRAGRAASPGRGVRDSGRTARCRGRQACRVSVVGATAQPLATSWASGEAAAAIAGRSRRTARRPNRPAPVEPYVDLAGALDEHGPRDDARRAGPERLLTWRSGRRGGADPRIEHRVGLCGLWWGDEQCDFSRTSKGRRDTAGSPDRWADLPLPPITPRHAVNRTHGAAR